MKQVLLLRGINVGGHRKLPMKELVAILEGLGASDVRTYIQSGNAVLSGGLSGAQISDAIEAAKGFRPLVLLLDGDKFRLIAKANPYPEAVIDGKSLHIWFLTAPSAFDDNKAGELAKNNERFHVSERAVYLHAPDGIGRSKLADKLEKIAGVPTTARNWNTIAKLLGMLDD